MNGYFDSYGSDPRRIQYAGSETYGFSVDYKQKYVQQLQVIKDNYATFAVPYNGEDNNDYVDGKGFCCNDGSLEAAQTRALARAAKNNFQEGNAYEKMQFYYHPDHLGSSSYITNIDGEVVSISSMFLSEKCSLRSATTFGIHSCHLHLGQPGSMARVSSLRGSRLEISGIEDGSSI